MVPKSQLYKGSRVYGPRVRVWSLPEGNASFDGITCHIATKSDNVNAIEFAGAQIDTIDSSFLCLIFFFGFFEHINPSLVPQEFLAG
jgi:hypothetical protein